MQHLRLLYPSRASSSGYARGYGLDKSPKPAWPISIDKHSKVQSAILRSSHASALVGSVSLHVPSFDFFLKRTGQELCLSIKRKIFHHWIIPHER